MRCATRVEELAKREQELTKREDKHKVFPSLNCPLLYRKGLKQML